MPELPALQKTAFLFPGQGSQYSGMGKGVHDAFPEAREVFEQANSDLPISITELCFEASDERLLLTENTQPAILTVSVDGTVPRCPNRAQRHAFFWWLRRHR